MKVIHFLGGLHKPWKQLYDVTSGAVVAANGTSSNTMQLHTLWWDVYTTSVADVVNQVVIHHVTVYKPKGCALTYCRVME